MYERNEFWTDGGSLWLPPEMSTTAGEVDAVFNFILWTGSLLTLFVTAAMVYFIWKYRRTASTDVPSPVRESKLLELSWITIPTILVLVVFFWGFRAYVSTTIPPADAYEVKVEGQKWFWTFEYPDGTVTQDSLVVPAGQPVKLVMSSRDVLHSFFVPEFRIKHDVLPNRYSYVWFEAPEEGTYQVLCTEYCGTDHSNMGAHIKVVDRQEFYTYLREGVGGGEGLPPAEYGEQLYTQRNCNTCHSVDGSAGTGPSWQGIWGDPRPGSDAGEVDSAYVHESIRNPGAYLVDGYQNQMVAYGEGLLPEDQLQAILSYIRVVNGVATPADTTIAAPDSTASGGTPTASAADA